MNLNIFNKRIIALFFSTLISISIFAGFIIPAMAIDDLSTMGVNYLAPNIYEFKEQAPYLQNISLKIDMHLKEEIALKSNEKIPIIIVLKEQHSENNVGRFDAMGIRSKTIQSQNTLMRFLSHQQIKAEDVTRHWIVNAISTKVLADDINAIVARPDVEKVWLDRKVKLIEPIASTVSTSYSIDYGDLKINADLLWKKGFNGTGVNISILDTGINTSHSDLDGGKVILERDFTNDGTLYDFNGHGTHVAGIAAGDRNRSSNVGGVAYGASLFNARVLDKTGSGYSSWIISGIEWSVNNYADVICMSLGGWQKAGCGTDPLSMAVTNAVNQGVIVAIAAGNEGAGEGTIGSPANAYGAIAVAASNEWDRIADFSSRGPTGDGRIGVDVAAPGVAIKAPDKIGGYVIKQGTSMAAPHVAGAAALLLGAIPTLSPCEFEAAIKNSAKDIGFNVLEQGAGRLDVASAYNVLLNGILIQQCNWNIGIANPETLIEHIFWINNNNLTTNVILDVAYSYMVDTQGNMHGNWATLPNNRVNVSSGENIGFNVFMNVPFNAVGTYVGSITFTNFTHDPIINITLPLSINVIQRIHKNTSKLIMGIVDEDNIGHDLHGDWIYYTLDIKYGVDRLNLFLNWSDINNNDLNLYLFNTTGLINNISNGTQMIETIFVKNPKIGNWTVAINAFNLTTTPKRYNLTISTVKESGTISGNVFCYQGHPIYNASIFARDLMNELHGSTRTDIYGNYALLKVPVGAYIIEVMPIEGTNLLPIVIPNILVNANEITVVNITLEKGFTISTAIIGSGKIEKYPFQEKYANGTIVNLTAVPDYRWKFVNWTGNITGTANTKYITVNNNKTIVATFEQIPNEITSKPISPSVSRGGGGGGGGRVIRQLEQTPEQELMPEPEPEQTPEQELMPEPEPEQTPEPYVKAETTPESEIEPTIPGFEIVTILISLLGAILLFKNNKN
ncbi:MAG: S8 family serine peptidase [Methanosarcinaceae archaeon]|nr:S8 family serine peptidase [Methanosarcinaceae archaeon]